MKTHAGRFGLHTATAVVVANMVGTGVFTSLGFQLEVLSSPFALLMLWVVGGVTAVCGALTYAEIGSRVRRSGGEYAFLGEIYHPAAGFISGWVSATVGFAAPTALAAITFATYLASVFPGLPTTWLAVGLILLLALVHGSTRGASGGFQRWSTTVKVVLIIGFCLCGFVLVEAPQAADLRPGPNDLSSLFTGGFAVSLIYVSYAYSGWNAATYVTGELQDPRRTLPLALGLGTLAVMVLYLGLNYVFLRAAPPAEMRGQVEVAYVAAEYIFGPSGARVMGVVLSLLMVSTVSAMVLAGPRVLAEIGKDYPTFRMLGRVNAHGIPTTAIAVQAGLSVIFILTSSFNTILVASGFTMGLNTALAAAGVFVLRMRDRGQVRSRAFRVPGFPVTPIVFLTITGWTLAYILRDRPIEAAIGLGVVVSGLGLWWVTRYRGRRAGSANKG